jgi:hypothetical protein
VSGKDGELLLNKLEIEANDLRLKEVDRSFFELAVDTEERDGVWLARDD